MMENIYFDYAATTPVSDIAKEAMLAELNNYANTSSIHSMGRRAKATIENSREKIAQLLKAKSKEIIFTSGGSESNNMVLQSLIISGEINHIITTEIEHAAVYKTVEYLKNQFNTKVTYIGVFNDGTIKMEELKKAIEESSEKTLVSIMHINNELGCVNDIQRIGEWCCQNNIKLHSDMVQSIGKIPVDLTQLNVDYASCSAHKFYGPKGIGFLYVKEGNPLGPLNIGGSQEKGKRAGTSPTFLIKGMEVALNHAVANLDEIAQQTLELKKYCWKQLQQIDGVKLNSDHDFKTPMLLSISVPIKDNMLSFQLDLKGIALSQGSACSSGANTLSRVFKTIFTKEEQEKYAPLRLSFSVSNTKKQIDYFVKELALILNHSKMHLNVRNVVF